MPYLQRQKPKLTGPNHRLHADLLRPIEGIMYLIIIDLYSKWVDVKEIPDITMERAIKAQSSTSVREGYHLNL